MPTSYNSYSNGKFTIPVSKLSTVTKQLTFEVVISSDNNDFVMDCESIGVVHNGKPGEKGDATVVTQFSNPASIVHVVNDAFVPNTVTTKVQVRSGVDFVKINKVSISKVQVDGETKTSYSNLVTLTPSLDSSKFENNVLTFTLGSGLAKATSVMNVTVKIETALGDFEEVKTISIQKIVQPCHLELTNDAEMIYTDSVGNVPSTVI